mmetsp:Transcript_56330/g.134440  ORF Transcript_56330/g.134440 Transcript_56330/m.134440 type:complete len:234 (-) Transcript_56330:3503-4204(-)
MLLHEPEETADGELLRISARVLPAEDDRRDEQVQDQKEGNLEEHHDHQQEEWRKLIQVCSVEVAGEEEEHRLAGTCKCPISGKNHAKAVVHHQHHRQQDDDHHSRDVHQLVQSGTQRGQHQAQGGHAAEVLREAQQEEKPTERRERFEAAVQIRGSAELREGIHGVHGGGVGEGEVQGPGLEAVPEIEDAIDEEVTENAVDDKGIHNDAQHIHRVPHVFHKEVVEKYVPRPLQ